MEFLKAQRTDVAYLYEVFKRSMQSCISAAWGAWDESKQYYRFIAELDIDNTWIVRHQDQRVGFIDKRNIGPVLLIQTLVIAPEHQRSGLGSRILKTVIAESEKLKVPIMLGVLKSNPDAKRFYESHGFVVVHEEKIYYQLRRQWNRC